MALGAASLFYSLLCIGVLWFDDQFLHRLCEVRPQSKVWVGQSQSSVPREEEYATFGRAAARRLSGATGLSRWLFCVAATV